MPGSSAQSATFIDESGSALARSQDVDELAKKIRHGWTSGLDKLEQGRSEAPSFSIWTVGALLSQ